MLTRLYVFIRCVIFSVRLSFNGDVSASEGSHGSDATDKETSLTGSKILTHLDVT
jgi:hypothetical protein